MLNISHTISVFFFLPVYVVPRYLTTRIRFLVFVCLGIGCVTLRDDTDLSGAREMEGIRDDASRKHREIVVLAHLAGTRACVTRRARKHTHAHIHTYARTPLTEEENHAQLSVVKSSAAQREGSPRKRQPRCEHRDGRLQLRCTHPVA